MKYIRTKDGRIVEFKENISAKIIEDMTVLGLAKYEGSEVIKQADDIEELFDEVVVKEKNRETHYSINWFGSPSDFTFLFKNTPDCEVYGAIQADKRPIHVAKLNDKGEWELL